MQPMPSIVVSVRRQPIDQGRHECNNKTYVELSTILWLLATSRKISAFQAWISCQWRYNGDSYDCVLMMHHAWDHCGVIWYDHRTYNGRRYDEYTPCNDGIFLYEQTFRWLSKSIIPFTKARWESVSVCSLLVNIASTSPPATHPFSIAIVERRCISLHLFPQPTWAE